MTFFASGLVNASARLSFAGMEHDYGTSAGIPALVGAGFVVTRSGEDYVVETGDEACPCTVDEIADVILGAHV